MAENKDIKQPEVQLQMLLDSVLSEEPTAVTFRGKRHDIGWLKKGTMRKFSHITMKEKNESKRNVKICVVMLLNNYWKIKFLYWVWWRWLYYVCDLDDVEVLRVANVAKKNTISGLLTAYHISDRDDGRDDDDDDDGAKSYPSRTSWGAAYSLGEKFGFLLERKFGVRAYDYWWGYSSAQIDLMVADQPLVVYPKRDRKMTKKRAEAAYAKWKERKAQEKETLIGKKVSLADFLK